MAVREATDVAYDGSNVEIRFGKHAFGLTKISWGDGLEPEQGSRIGHQENNFTTDGKYKTEESSVTMETAEAARMLSLMPSNGYGNFRFQALIVMSHADTGSYKVVLDGCRAKGLKESVENSSTANMVEFTLIVKQIYRKRGNGQWKTINRTKGRASSGASQMML